MKKIFGIITFCLMLCSACTKSLHTAQQNHSKSFEDGIYLIERTGNVYKSLLPLSENEQVITFNKEFIEKTDQDVTYIVINTNEYAPLQLELAPETQEQEDARKRLLLRLTADATEKLAKFTTKHVAKGTTIVVNQEALTMHKIREPITSGLLQITRCTDNACELLNIELQDNVVKD